MSEWELKMGFTYTKQGGFYYILLRFSFKWWQIFSYFPSPMANAFSIFFLVLICKFLRVWQYSLKWQNPFWANLQFLCQNNEKFTPSRSEYIYEDVNITTDLFILFFCLMSWNKTFWLELPETPGNGLKSIWLILQYDESIMEIIRALKDEWNDSHG